MPYPTFNWYFIKPDLHLVEDDELHLVNMRQRISPVGVFKKEKGDESERKSIMDRNPFRDQLRLSYQTYLYVRGQNCDVWPPRLSIYELLNCCLLHATSSQQRCSFQRPHQSGPRHVGSEVKRRRSSCGQNHPDHVREVSSPLFGLQVYEVCSLSRMLMNTWTSAGTKSTTRTIRSRKLRFLS